MGDTLTVGAAQSIPRLLNSYSLSSRPNASKNHPTRSSRLARQAGLEPATCGLEVRCSVQLSYWRGGSLNPPPQMQCQGEVAPLGLSPRPRWTIMQSAAHLRDVAMRLRRAFAFLEILFVLLILGLLIGGFSWFGGLADSADSGAATNTLNRAQATGCEASRRAAEANVEMWLVNHSGGQISGDLLRASGVSTRCPHSRTGGTFVYLNGTVYCTDHFPPVAPAPQVPVSPPPAGSSGTGTAQGGRPNPIPGVRLPPMP